MVRRLGGGSKDQDPTDPAIRADAGRVHPEAPHSFFDRGFAEHEAACTDAWQRILAFTAAHGRAG